MKVEIEVSEKTYKKLRMLMDYTGMDIHEVQEIASNAVDIVLTQVLCGALQKDIGEAGTYPGHVEEDEGQETQDHEPESDYAGEPTYDGVGEAGSDEYEDEDEDGSHYPEMPAPRNVRVSEVAPKRIPRNEFGITDEDLEHDDDVEDPEHEGIQQAPGSIRGIADDSEGLFAALSGMAVEEDPRAIRRKAKSLKSRAKVTGMEG